MNHWVVYRVQEATAITSGTNGLAYRILNKEYKQGFDFSSIDRVRILFLIKRSYYTHKMRCDHGKENATTENAFTAR